MGRMIVANNGYFLTKVLYEKVNKEKRFVIVDGAMNDFIRPSLYGAYHKVELLKDKQSNISTADIVGPVCESGDFIAKNIDIAQTQQNDLIIVKSAGAYCYSLSSNYNSRTKCAEISIENGKDKIIKNREKFDDLIEDELMCIKNNEK
jgi:diaminopimelate decarboxylase